MVFMNKVLEAENERICSNYAMCFMIEIHVFIHTKSDKLFIPPIVTISFAALMGKIGAS